MNIFKEKRTVVLAATVAVVLGASASDVNGQQPAPGGFYLYNEFRGQYLAVDGNGKLHLTDAGQLLTLDKTDEATGSYTLTFDRGVLGTTFHGPLTVGTVSDEDERLCIQWMFKPVNGKHGVYTLSCRDNTASAADYMYYSTLTGSICTTYSEPTAGGEWKLVNASDAEQIVTIDETDDTYTKPTLQTATVRVHLRRTFTPGSWNSLCLPFSVSVAQFKAQVGKDIQLVEFDKYENNTLFCRDVADIAIEAGKPYLVWYPTASGGATDFYEFSDVTAFADNPVPTTSNGVSFAGAFKRTTAPTGAVVLRNNHVYTLGKPTAMKGTRAYFAQTEQSAAVAPIMFWSIDSKPTDIKRVFAGGRSVDIYDVHGVLVRSNATDANGLPVGVYVVDGRKFMVK